MKNYARITSLSALGLLVAGYLAVQTPLQAAGDADSAEITKLLNDAKTEAAGLTQDSSEMLAFTNSNLSWESYAGKIEMVKGHINSTGKLVAKLKDLEPTGSAWQRTAITRVEPVLRELATNTETTIGYLNANRTKIHLPQFRDYMKANYELSSSMETLIKDFLGYGEAKEKLERLARKLEISE
jgi:hypothetical protein